MSSPAAVSLDKKNKKVSDKLPRVSPHSGPDCCFFLTTSSSTQLVTTHLALFAHVVYVPYSSVFMLI